MARPYSIQRFKGNDNDHESPEIAAPNKRTIGLTDMCGVILFPIVAHSDSGRLFCRVRFEMN